MRLTRQSHPTGRGEAGPTAHNGARGFTIIETVVAMLIMLIAGLSATSLFVYSMRNNTLAGARLAALALAQQRMERLRNVPFDDASLDAGTINETLTVTGSVYTVQTTVCAASTCGGSDTIKRITLQVTPYNSTTNDHGADSAITLTAERAALVTGPYLQ